MLARQLDVDNIRSGVDVLSVRIIACDTDPPRAECRNLPVAIIAQSVADNDPIFSDNQCNVAIVEDTPVRSTIIATVMCSDQDSEVGAYGGMDIVNVIPSTAEDQLFLLDSSPPEEKTASGDLILQGELDYKQPVSTT